MYIYKKSSRKAWLTQQPVGKAQTDRQTDRGTDAGRAALPGAAASHPPHGARGAANVLVLRSEGNRMHLQYFLLMRLVLCLF